DGLRRRNERDAGILEPLQSLIEVSDRTAEPADAIARDDRDVAPLRPIHELCEAGSLRVLPGVVQVLEDLDRATFERRQHLASLELRFRRDFVTLIFGGEARDADVDESHGRTAHRHSLRQKPTRRSTRPTTLFFARRAIRFGFPLVTASTSFAVRAAR